MQEEVKSIIQSRQKAEATIRQALISFIQDTGVIVEDIVFTSEVRNPLSGLETQFVLDLKINTRLPIVN